MAVLRQLALAFAAVAASGHPLDEELFRLDLGVLLPADGLVLEARVMHGGLRAREIWVAHDHDGNGRLDEAEQSAWAAELLARPRLRVDGREVRLAPAACDYPDQVRFLTCEQPITLRSALLPAPARQRPVPVEVEVPADPARPQLVRIEYVAVLSTGLESAPPGVARASARVTWPVAGAPLDTRLAARADDWLWRLPAAVEQPVLPALGGSGVPTRRAGVAGWWFGVLALLAGMVAVCRRAKVGKESAIGCGIGRFVV